MPRQGISLVRALAATILVVVLFPVAVATAQDTAEHSTNLQHVKNLPYEQRNADGTANHGTDLEFAKIRGRRVLGRRVV